MVWPPRPTIDDRAADGIAGAIFSKLDFYRGCVWLLSPADVQAAGFGHVVAACAQYVSLLRGARMSSSSNLHLAHIAAIAGLVTAFGLAGCGRKGGLDPPPGATPAETSVSRPDLEPAIAPDGRVIAPTQGPKRSTPLDFLLN
jgi:predicted small lipoprotein YifL